jgi:hypothetical protein
MLNNCYASKNNDGNVWGLLGNIILLVSYQLNYDQKWQNIFKRLWKALSIKACERMNRYSTFWFRFIRVRYICKDMKKETIQNAGANVLIQGHRCYRCNHEWKPNNMQKTPRVCPLMQVSILG